MFKTLTDQTLSAAHDAARLLYRHHRELNLGPLAIKLDTLSADITVELENRKIGTSPSPLPSPKRSSHENE